MPVLLSKLSIFISYKEVFIKLVNIPKCLSAAVFIFFYNFPEGQIVKIFPLYLLDQKFSIEQVGWISGVISLSGMLLGLTLSGWFLNRFTLKKCLLIFTLLSALANIGYFLCVKHYFNSMGSISCFIAVTQFCFGLCNGAYMLYIIQLFSKSKRYSMSLYAIGTAIMLAGGMVAGGVSGYLQTWLGYENFFLWIALSGIGIVALAFYNTRRVL